MIALRLQILVPVLARSALHRPRRSMAHASGAAAAAAASSFELEMIDIENPQELNFILGHAHFIQTADDLAEICARQGVPRFGAAFCEASEGHPSMPGRRVRSEGNDFTLRQLAERNALALGAGHSFLLFIDGAFPLSVLSAIKAAPTVCRVYCATSNPTSVILARRGADKKGILGVIDGLCPQQVESDDDKHLRKDFLRSIGYKR